MVLVPLMTAAAQYAVLTRRGVPPEVVASRVAATIRSGGMVSQKVAQVVVSRPDIITDVDLVRELRELQSREVSPDVHQASIATVTLDRLEGTAVKCFNDASVLRDGAKLEVALRVLRPLRPALPNLAVMVDMIETLLNELDFGSELAKNRLLRDSLDGSDCVIVPETLASSDTRVVMRIVDSVLAKDLGDRAAPLDVVNGFFRDMTMAAVRTGVVHLDLHSGNVGYCSESSKIVVYDMGSIRQVDTDVSRRAMRSMLKASELLFFGDWDGLAEYLVHRNLVVEVKDTRNLRLLTDVSMRYARGDATAVDIGMCLREIKGDVNLDASVFQLIQSISILEGCCKVLNPAFTVSRSFAGVGVFEILEILEG
jgi:predicted unusual protein kinase regulating ubiquinone biosynthesis (AarF/ABC1/UbiB family)